MAQSTSCLKTNGQFKFRRMNDIIQGVPKKTHHKVLCNVSSIFSKYEPVSEMHHSQKTEIYTSI